MSFTVSSNTIYSFYYGYHVIDCFFIRCFFIFIHFHFHLHSFLLPLFCFIHCYDFHSLWFVVFHSNRCCCMLGLGLCIQSLFDMTIPFSIWIGTVMISFCEVHSYLLAGGTIGEIHQSPVTITVLQGKCHLSPCKKELHLRYHFQNIIQRGPCCKIRASGYVVHLYLQLYAQVAMGGYVTSIHIIICASIYTEKQERISDWR